jgi:hypothetical protein
MRVLYVFASMWLCAAASAEKLQSVYTTHDYGKCELVEKDEDFESRRCEGHDGIAVNWHSEEDSATVSFGSVGFVEDEFPFASEGFVSIVFAHDTVEWIGPVRDGKVVPIAAILRYRLGHGGAGQELMVYKLIGKEKSCLAARIDANTGDADEKARKIAQERVPAFACGKDKVLSL